MSVNEPWVAPFPAVSAQAGETPTERGKHLLRLTVDLSHEEEVTLRLGDMIPGPFPINFILCSNVIPRHQGIAAERHTLTFDMVINAVTTPFHMPVLTVDVIVPYRIYSVDERRVPLGALPSCVKINASSEGVAQNLPMTVFSRLTATIIIGIQRHPGVASPFILGRVSVVQCFVDHGWVPGCERVRFILTNRHWSLLTRVCISRKC